MKVYYKQCNDANRESYHDYMGRRMKEEDKMAQEQRNA